MLLGDADQSSGQVALTKAHVALIGCGGIGSPALQYLAGVTCMRLQLWGKARQLLQQSLVRQQDAGLRRNAWRQLADLALEQGDEQGATDAWKRAAQG